MGSYPEWSFTTKTRAAILHDMEPPAIRWSESNPHTKVLGRQVVKSAGHRKMCLVLSGCGVIGNMSDLGSFVRGSSPCAQTVYAR